MSSRPSEDDVFYGRSLSGTDFHGLRVNTLKLENLIHRFFGDARLGIELKDRFGKPFRPREWFLVPLEMVEQAIAMLEDGSIVGHVMTANWAGSLRSLSGYLCLSLKIRFAPIPLKKLGVREFSA